MRKMKKVEKKMDTERTKGYEKKRIKCSRGMIRKQKEIEGNRHYQREERPKCQRIKVTNTPPVTLQLLSLIGGLGN